MTIDEFIETLWSIRRTWECSERGPIRTSTGCDQFCPLTAVAFERCAISYTVDEYPEAGRLLGLPADTAHEISMASDGVLLSTSAVFLRKRLLAACGL